MPIFERYSPFRRPGRPAVGGFSLTELLVVMAIVALLSAIAAAAFSTARSSLRRLRTAATIAKLNAIVAPHFASYASLNVAVSGTATRSSILFDRASNDLPDRWEDIESRANAVAAAKAKGVDVDPPLTPHQQAYISVWNSITNKTAVKGENSGAECLFMIVMQGGISDCLDCRMSGIDVGDTDRDGMPEFLDAWGTPIGFVLWPRDLRLPGDSTTTFFAATDPFASTIDSLISSKGGLMRPLIVSAGPDKSYGISESSAPLPESIDHLDNVTNFDEEARR